MPSWNGNRPSVYREWRTHAGAILSPNPAIPSSYYTLDVSPITTVANTATQSSVLRDAGFQTKGYFLNDKLQYRLGVFDGQRDSNGRNSLRTTDICNTTSSAPTKVYVFTGTALGKQKILAVDSGFDKQALTAPGRQTWPPICPCAAETRSVGSFSTCITTAGRSSSRSPSRTTTCWKPPITFTGRKSNLCQV